MNNNESQLIYHHLITKNMNVDLGDLVAWADETLRSLGREIEQAEESVQQQKKMMLALEELEDLAKENEMLRAQLEQERAQRAELEMHLAELSKLSAGVAKKAKQEELLKALRTYINISKRKTLSKRVAVKGMILELASAIGIVFPEDMVATLEALDDEQSEPKVMVQGNVMMNAPTFNGPMYDVHGNEEVKLNN